MNQTRSLSKSIRNLSSTPSKSQKAFKNTSESDHYFCHYKNAMYMGGIKAFQKHGRGILLHDNGTSAVTNYFNDFKNGHNIFYKQNCIMSVEYRKNKIIQCAIRISMYMLLIRFNRQETADGKSLLIDYEQRRIFYVLYKKGQVIEKHEQKDSSIINRVFDLDNIEYLIGEKHTSALQFSIEKDQYIASQFRSNKFEAGFFQKGLLNGLGFVILAKNSQIDNSQNNQLQISLSERGYYYNGQLNGVGQKYYKNGSLYIGEFKSSNFEGNGILKNDKKNNWVYGSFESGNLCQMIEYSNGGNLDRAKFEKLVERLHEKKNNWIDKSIETESQQQFTKEIEKILMSNPTEKLKNLREKKQQVLRKIQDNFFSDLQSEEEEGSNQVNQQNMSNNSNKGSFQDFKINVRPVQFVKNDSSSSDSRYISSQNKFNSRFPPPNKDLTRQMATKQTRQSSSRFKPLNKPYQQPSNVGETSSSRAQNRGASEIKSEQERTDEPTFALDSKRFVGRSRIFRQINSEEDSLPRFNYKNID